MTHRPQSESEQHFRGIFDAVGEALFVLQEDRVVDCNPAALELFGRSRDELVGQPLATLYPQVSAGQAPFEHPLAAGIEAAGSATGQRFELQLAGPEGALVWVEVGLTSLRPPTGRRHLVASMRDIGERKQREKTLSARIGVLESITYAAERLLRTTEWESEVPHLLTRIGEATRASRVSLWVSSEDGEGELVARSRFHWAAQGERERVREIDRKTSLPGSWASTLSRGEIAGGIAGAASEAERSFLSAQGVVSFLAAPIMVDEKLWGFLRLDDNRRAHSWRWAERRAIGAVARTLAAAVVRQRDQRTLQEAEEKYRGLFESSVAGIYQSSPGGGFLTANPALAEILGYDSPEQLLEEVTDLGADLFVDPDERAEQARRAREDGKGSYVARFRRRDGKAIWVSGHSRAIRDAEGRIVRYEGTLVDETERIRAEEAMRAANRRLAATLDVIPDFLFEVDADGLICEFRVPSTGPLFLDARDFVDRPLAEAFPEAAALAIKKALEGVRQSGEKTRELYGLSTPAGNRFFELTASPMPVTDDEKDDHIIVLVCDVTDRRRVESAMSEMVKGAFSAAGEGFLEAMVLQLAELLQVDAVMVGEVQGEGPDWVRSLALCSNGEITDPIVFDLEGTPSDRVLGHGACVCVTGVQEEFPDDALLEELGIEGYIGIPLLTTQGGPLGILEGLSRRPIIDPSFKLELLGIFAARTVAEIERSRAERAMRESEALLRSVLDNAQALITLKSRQGRYLLVNRRMETALGRSRESLVGMTDYDVFPPEVAEKMRQAHDETLISDRTLQREMAIPLADGEHVFLVTLVPVKALEGPPYAVCGIATDVTRLSRLRDAALEMAEGRFDPELLRDEGDEYSELADALTTLGTTLENKLAELHNLAQVTEKINSGLVLDEILDHLYDSFRPIIPFQRIGVALIDEKAGTVTAHWARSDLPATKIQKGYSAPLAGSSLVSILETKKPRILNDLEEYLVRHPESDSTRRIVAEGIRSSLTCPLIALGKPVGFIFFSSSEKHAYRAAHVEMYQQIAGQLATIVEKGRLYQKLIELDELKSKFLGIVAHDLKNPIAVVATYCELLERGDLGAMEEDQSDAIQQIRSAADNMQVLVDELLDIRAIEMGKLELHLEATDVRLSLLQGLSDQALIARSKGIDLELDVKEDLPEILMDRHRMRQALANLVSNAIKFSHAASTVTIGAKRSNGDVCLFVRDQGIGIPQHEMAEIFQEFARGSSLPTGGEKSTGLGLAIVQRIIETHGGSVRVDSEVGEGSTFYLTLPLADPAAEAEGPTPTA